MAKRFASGYKISLIKSMTSEERRKLEQQLSNSGAKQSKYDPNKWTDGNSTYKFTGNNTLNDNGSGSSGYGTIKDHIGKKGN